MSATWTEDDLILHLRSHGSVSVADLTYAFGGSPQSHTKRLEKMVASGKLDKRRLSGKKFQYHLKRASSGTPTMKNLRDRVIKLAYARPELRDDLLPLLKEAGCEKLPEGPMRDNCEKSKKDGVQPGKGKSKSKKKDDGKMPPELLEKFKAKKKASKMSLREKAIRLAYANPELRDDLLPLLKEAKSKKKDLPEELKKHQFTSEDNPNPKGNDKDGDGETGEEKPFTSKKALRAAIKMAYANPELRDRLLPLIKKAKSKHEKQFDDAKMLSKVDPALAKVMTTSGGSDDKIKVKTYSGSAASLKPSQTELIVGKSLGQALAMLDGKMPLTGDLGAIISKDNHIMDGHHRWVARILAKGEGASVTGMQADLLGKDLVKALNILTKGAFGRNQGNKGKGNIKEFTPANVKKALEGFLKKGIPGEFPWSPEDVKKTLEKSFGSVEEGVKTMSENAENVVKSVPSWAVDRQEMPVINEKDLPKAKGILEKGELDWNKPYKQA